MKISNQRPRTREGCRHFSSHHYLVVPVLVYAPLPSFFDSSILSPRLQKSYCMPY